MKLAIAGILLEEGYIKKYADSVFSKDSVRTPANSAAGIFPGGIFLFTLLFYLLEMIQEEMK